MTAVDFVVQAAAAATRTGEIFVFGATLDSFKRTKVFDHHATALAAIGVGALAVGSGDGQIAIVDMTDRSIRRFVEQQHHAGITSLVWLGGDYLISTAYDNEIRLWSIATGRALSLPTAAHQSGTFRKGIVGCTFDPETRTLFTIGADSIVVAWSAKDPAELHPVATHPLSKSESTLTGIVASICWAPRQKIVVVGSSNGEVQFLHFDSKQNTFSKVEAGADDGEKSTERAISSVAIDGTSSHLLVARWDGTVSQWSMGEGRECW